MVKIIRCVLFFSFALFLSCSTLQHDRVYTGATKQDTQETVEQIEKNLVGIYAKLDSSGNLSTEIEKLEKVKKDLNNLLATPSTDFVYLAKVYALYADYHLVRGEKKLAKKMLKIAQGYSSYEEYVQLVTARLILKDEDRKSYLADTLKNSPTSYRLMCELGSTYYLIEDYTNALVFFDAALDFLPEEYSLRFSEKREYCRRFYKIGNNVKKETARILERDKIFLLDMTTLTQENTHDLDFITGTNTWKSSLLAERLKAAGWYAPDANITKDFVTRKDAALFLWHLLVGNKSEMLTRYSRKYSQSNSSSPISDVNMDGLYFDAILGTVEEFIIPLADGTKFEPNKNVAGLEFYNWLKTVEDVR